MIIFYGPCDITALSTYIKKTKSVYFIEKNTTGTFDLCESTYWVQGIHNQKVNHPFVSDYSYPNIDFHDKNLEAIVISLLSEIGRGLYKNQKNQYLKFGFPDLDATHNYQSNYKAEVDWYGKEAFECLSKEWLFEGPIQIDDVINNYYTILANIPTRIRVYILLTPTFDSKYGETNQYFNKVDGKSIFLTLNNNMKANFSNRANITFIDPIDYYKSPKKISDLFYYNSPSIRHYPRSCYRSIAFYLSKKRKIN